MKYKITLNTGLEMEVEDTASHEANFNSLLFMWKAFKIAGSRSCFHGESTYKLKNETHISLAEIFMIESIKTQDHENT